MRDQESSLAMSQSNHRRKTFSEEKILDLLRWIEAKKKKGAGQGYLDQYSPWLKTWSVSSHGNKSLVMGWKTNRPHHLLSGLELKAYYHCEWAEAVVDIREQFPLLPLQETLGYAEVTKIRHPTNPRTKTPVVMTTDLVLCIREGIRERLAAVAIKPASELQKKRVQEKLLLERMFWEERGVLWKVATGDDLSEALYLNMRWLHSHYSRDYLRGISPPAFIRIREKLIPAVERRNKGLAQLCADIDQRLRVPSGSAMEVLRHLLCHRTWQFDMDQLIDLRTPLSLPPKGATLNPIWT